MRFACLLLALGAACGRCADPAGSPSAAEMRAWREARGVDSLVSGAKVRTAGTQEAADDARVQEFVLALAAAKPEERDALIKSIVDMGAKAVPALSELTINADAELAKQALELLPKFKGKPGAGNHGLNLAALPAGPRPMPGQCVPLLVTLTNESDKDISILKYWWHVVVAAPLSNGKGKFFGENPVPRIPADFHTIKPGESFSALIDCDLYPDSGASDKLQCRLIIVTPNLNWDDVPAGFYAPQHVLFSPGFDIVYAADRAPPPLLDTMRLLCSDDAATKGKAVQKLEQAGDAALAALREALRGRDEDERWAAFEWICQHPHPALANDLIGFWGRHGNAFLHGDVAKMFAAYSAALPLSERRKFLKRAAAVKPNDEKFSHGLVHFLPSTTIDENEIRLEIALQLYEHGYRNASHLSFMSGLLSYEARPPLRNPKLGLQMAEEYVKLKPENPQGWGKLALAQLVNTQWDEAIATADKALAMKPDDKFLLQVKQNVLDNIAANRNRPAKPVKPPKQPDPKDEAF